MASYTTNLNLLKKSPVTDGNDTFNVDTMLNENWDKIDSYAKETRTIANDVKTKLSNITVTGSFSIEMQSSGSITKTINLGFRPRLVLIYSKYNEGAPTEFYTDAYRHIRIIDGSGPTGSITSNGFRADFRFRGDFAIKTLYYIAFK